MWKFPQQLIDWKIVREMSSLEWNGLNQWSGLEWSGVESLSGWINSVIRKTELVSVNKAQ
jgi:hypothetical protein